MMKMLKRLIGEQIKMTWIPEKNPGTVMMDPAQLEQIMANLCVNARDAIGGVGQITIETRNMFIDAAFCARNPEYRVGEHVMLAVSDNGCGMDAEVQQQIFEPFYTTKPKGEGTGLGLATVFGIVKQNDAFINVHSETGKGTTFKIYFKQYCEDAVTLENGQNEKKPLPMGNGEVILLVEDEAMVLNVSKSILEKLNYRVIPANSPSEAINAVEKSVNLKISLLLTDLMMPEMSGAELAIQIEKRLPDIRTLYTSAYTANMLCNKGMLGAGVHFLQKPASIDEMAFKIDEILNS